MRTRAKTPKQIATTAVTVLAALVIALALSSCDAIGGIAQNINSVSKTSRGETTFKPEEIPQYSGNPSAEINGNVPFFTEHDLSLNPFEMYSSLDSLGRCGEAYALLGPETMPKTSRRSIGMVKPSGWQIAKYDWIDGKYLFNRCHLIAYSLAGENDNPLNLITGTRTMNAIGMLFYEERVAMYIDSTSNHVLYRVTPVFEGDNLVASGVLMEAESIEDKGKGIRFCAWCYNVEPGVVINYATGDNRAGNPENESFDDIAVESVTTSIDASATSAADEKMPENTTASEPSKSDEPQTETYVLNTNTHRFHHPDCPSVLNMKEKNKQFYEGTREDVIEQGYTPCGVCKP